MPQGEEVGGGKRDVELVGGAVAPGKMKKQKNVGEVAHHKKRF